MIDATGSTDSMRPATWPLSGMAASMSPPKYSWWKPAISARSTWSWRSRREVRSVRSARSPGFE